MGEKTTFYPGLDVYIRQDPLGFAYGDGVCGPAPEQRTLSQIRGSLRDANASGPEIVYAIAMDVSKKEHRQNLLDRMLLFGVVTYASGRLGDEPIRSQGHIHRVSEHSGWSPPEIYEIWSGKAYIYMQEKAEDHPGRCFAVYAEPGDVVVVPPFWAHATISADPNQALTFGAWCDREYGFEYDEIKARNGLAWYPIVEKDGRIKWVRNERYEQSELVVKKPGDYSRLGITSNQPIYEQFAENPDRFQFVSKPGLKGKSWISFTP
ncbi:glucose-6-phosphate isomerase family protein [Cohnella hongkongensis]|uniref:glucose-6-phosphate isomerase n=1 Tax=Cohnella hongkongensis TaxID=178337 RepID=A0ABV9FGJ1_9BACL